MAICRIAFRTDASIKTGTGHFMRCLTLADALKQRGSQISFVCRELPANLRDTLRRKGMECIALDGATATSPFDDLAHSSWLGTTQEQDAKATLQALSGNPIDWLVVDHYALDYRWESLLRRITKQIMVIDDIADRRHDCNVLLDQNFYADMDSRYIGIVPEDCQLLLGPRYALLRNEFQDLHRQVKPRGGPVRRILVFLGGVDIDNYTGLVVEALSGIDISGLQVDVVVGAAHPSLGQIKEACRHHEFICHVQTDKMAELMASADLAIGAGGSASWERCCLGLPAVLVALADNQINIAKALDLLGASVYAGISTEVDMEALRRAITNFASNVDLLKSLSVKAFSLVDGMGVERVCKTVSC